MRTGLPLLICLSLCLLLSLSFSIDVSAQPPPPVLNSAVVSADYYTVLLTFTPGQSSCSAFFCWFTVWVDNGAETNILFDGSSVYYFTLYVNSETYPAGIYSFYITEGAMGQGNSPPSNTITVNVPAIPPPSNPQLTPLIVGDPQFTGIRGQSYQIHGIADEVFSIISDIDLQYNSRFVFLHQGACPTVDTQQHKVDTPCFTHPGTYLGEVGLETASGDRLYIQAGTALEGFQTVTLNDKPLSIGTYITLTPSSVTRPRRPFISYNSSHILTVLIGNFLIEFTNSDMFVNQMVTMLDASQETSHGLLGQTWATRIYRASATVPWIEGEVWDYATADHELFSHRFVYNKFKGDDEDDNGDEDATPRDDDEEELKKTIRKAEAALGLKLRANERPPHSLTHSHSHRHESHDE